MVLVVSQETLRVRVRVLSTVAERYRELVDPLNGPSGIRGDGESPAGMPPTYTATVKEFERLMGVMRNQAQQKAFRGVSLGTLRWHLLEWFLKAEWVVHQQPKVVKKHGKKRLLMRVDERGVLVPQTDPKPVARRHRDARLERAELGLEWMARNWGLRQEPELPQQIVVAKEKDKERVAA